MVFVVLPWKDWDQIIYGTYDIDMVIVQPIWNVEGEMDWERSNDLILAGRELIKGKWEKVRFEAKISSWKWINLKWHKYILKK